MKDFIEQCKKKFSPADTEKIVRAIDLAANVYAASGNNIYTALPPVVTAGILIHETSSVNDICDFFSSGATDEQYTNAKLTRLFGQFAQTRCDRLKESIRAFLDKCAKRYSKKRGDLNEKTEDYLNVSHALEFACECHAGQRRKSGEPYIIHPLAVGDILLESFNADPECLSAGLLHDVI